jgi:hypothetical protein
LSTGDVGVGVKAAATGAVRGALLGAVNFNSGRSSRCSGSLRDRSLTALRRSCWCCIAGAQQSAEGEQGPGSIPIGTSDPVPAFARAFLFLAALLVFRRDESNGPALGRGGGAMSSRMAARMPARVSAAQCCRGAVSGGGALADSEEGGRSGKRLAPSRPAFKIQKSNESSVKRAARRVCRTALFFTDRGSRK